MEDDYSNLHFLIKQCIRWFATKSSLHKIGYLSRTHKVSSCWATTNSLITWEILDPKDKELSEGRTSITTAHGELPIHLSPTLETISHNRCRLCWTHLTMIGNTTQQNNNKGYITIFAVCDKGCTHWDCHKSHHRSNVAAITCYIARQGNHKQSTQTKVPTSKVQQTNFMKSTTCFNPQHR